MNAANSHSTGLVQSMPGLGAIVVVMVMCPQSKRVRHSGMRHLAQARNPYSLQGLWIPGSRKSAPRNDEVSVADASHPKQLRVARLDLFAHRLHTCCVSPVCIHA